MERLRELSTGMMSYMTQARGLHTIQTGNILQTQDKNQLAGHWPRYKLQNQRILLQFSSNAWSTRYLRWPCPTPGMVCHVQEMELWCNSAHWTYKTPVMCCSCGPGIAICSFLPLIGEHTTPLADLLMFSFICCLLIVSSSDRSNHNIQRPVFTKTEWNESSLFHKLHTCGNGHGPFVACVVATTADVLSFNWTSLTASSTQEKKQTALCTHYATGYLAPRSQRPRSQVKCCHKSGLDGITIGLEQSRVFSVSSAPFPEQHEANYDS